MPNEYDDTQLLPQNMRRRMMAGFQRNGRGAVDPLEDQVNPMQAVVPANNPPQTVGGSAPSSWTDAYTGAVGGRGIGGSEFTQPAPAPAPAPGPVAPAARAVTPTVPSSEPGPGGHIQYTPFGGYAAAMPTTQMPVAPAARGPGMPVSTGPGTYVDPMNPGAQIDLNLSQNLSDRSAARMFPGADVNSLRGANPTAFEERTWQNTPLAPGLPTFQDIERMRGQGTLGYGPREQRQAMEDYVALLTGQSSARTQAGQLDLGRGELGLRAGQAFGMNGLPGAMENDAARTQEALRTGEFARSPEQQLRTVLSSILTAQAGQGATPTAEGVSGITRALGRGFGGDRTTPGSPNPFMSPSSSGATPMPGAGGVSPTVGQGPPTGNEGDPDHFQELFNQVRTAAGRNPALTPEQQITNFIQEARPTERNINAVMAAAQQHFGPVFGPDAVQRWFTARDSRGATDVASGLRRQIRDSMNRIQPGIIGASSYNPLTQGMDNPVSQLLLRLGGAQ